MDEQITPTADGRAAADPETHKNVLLEAAKHLEAFHSEYSAGERLRAMAGSEGLCSCETH